MKIWGFLGIKNIMADVRAEINRLSEVQKDSKKICRDPCNDGCPDLFIDWSTNLMDPTSWCHELQIQDLSWLLIRCSRLTDIEFDLGKQTCKRKGRLKGTRKKAGCSIQSVRFVQDMCKNCSKKSFRCKDRAECFPFFQEDRGRSDPSKA